jgi:glycosyltransferase involved in cell wall biosynthesis
MLETNLMVDEPNEKIGAKDFLSIIVPVYNEEKKIKSVLLNLKQIATRLPIECEIIVIDDGSTDKSTEIINNIDGIRMIGHVKNKGYGSSLKTGIKNAHGNLIAIIDGDGSYPVEMIVDLVSHTKDYDMVVGARSMNSKNIPLIRKPAKWCLGKLANYLAEYEIPDLNSGLRVFKKDAALKFFHIYPSGFSFTTTITLAMHCYGYEVKYIPIEYGKREGKSKIRPIKDTFNFLQLIWRTVMYFNPLKVFLPMTIFMFLFFFISLLFDTFILHDLTEKTVILFGAFSEILAIGLVADLIDKRNPLFKHIE